MNNVSRNACRRKGHDHHTNAFVLLNGIPYLLAEYLDNRSLLPIDSASVKSEINIDQTDCMQTIIDISIDDVGHKSDGSLNVIGNRTKLMGLYKVIQSNKKFLENQLPVIRRGLVLQINYQLENQRTGQVMRSAVENIRIQDRSYFMTTNTADVGDNAIVINFSNSAVSTVNHFTNGLDPMILRITNIQMYYERVKRNPLAPRNPTSLITDPELAQYFYGNDADLYKYHQSMQSQHAMSSSYGNDILDSGIEGSWGIFDRYYHFDLASNDIIIHDEEVYRDPKVKLVKIPCGTIAVGRSFVVNPGTRLVFKTSVWKNDLIIVNNTNEIAKFLRPNLPYYYPTNNTPSYGYCPMQQKPTNMDYAQNSAINYLNDNIADLSALVDTLCDVGDEGYQHEIPPLPEQPVPVCPKPRPPYDPGCPGCMPPPVPFPPPPGPDRRRIIGKLAKNVKDLQNAVDVIEETGVYQEDLLPFPLEVIRQLVQEAADATDDDPNNDPIPVDPDTDPDVDPSGDEP